MGQQSREIAGEEHLILTVPHHNPTGVTQPDGHDLIRLILREGHYRVGASDLSGRRPKGILQGILLVEIGLDEVRNTFGVGLRLKYVTLCLEFAFQLHIVLDNAVVGHHNVALAVGVGVCVEISRAPVGRPTGVADSSRALGQPTP